MASPFPGMNPYLEVSTLWPAFHQQMIAALYQVLLPALSDRYRLRVGVREYTSELPLFTSVLRENHHEEFLEIRGRPEGRLVTLLEVVSLGNRTTSAGRAHYHQTRDRAKQESAALVEIDLITQGQPLLEFPRQDLPEHDYTITVARPTARERFEIYVACLEKRLPKFRLPLAADDKDTVLDLQTVFGRAYDQGHFATKIDEHAPLPSDVKLRPETRAWLDHQPRPGR